MPSRKDIGRRSRAKSLQKLNKEKEENPEKFIHDVSDKSRYLAMQYDDKTGSLSPYKRNEYERLKKMFEVEDEK